MQKMSKQEKVAALLLMLGEDLAAEVLKHVERREVVEIVSAMQRLGRVDASTLDQIAKEFSQALGQKDTSIRGSPEKVNSLLNKAFKGEKAANIAAQLSKATPRIESAERIDPRDLSKLLANEHPQTLALILSHLSPAKMAEAIKALASDLRQEVLVRISRLDHVSAEMVLEVEDILRERLSQTTLQSKDHRGGAAQIAQMLNKLDPEERKKMLQGIASRDAEMAEQVTNLLFIFEDLIRLSPQDFQLSVRETSIKTWLSALKAASPELQAAFFASFSVRARTTVKEDFEALAKIKKTEALQAQDQILEKVKSLRAAGKILSFEDDLV